MGISGIIRRWVGWGLIALVVAYQLALRPLLVGACRFEPSCSEYAIEAIRRHGPLRGGWMAAVRIWRCRPGSVGGYDPVA